MHHKKNFLSRWWSNIPPFVPTETELRQWASSHWVEYQAWLFHHSFLTLYDWQQLRNRTLSWSSPPFISLVTPVFNTPLAYLRECIHSVQTQAYPYWELCLVDDGSDHPEVLTYLKTCTRGDSRLRLVQLPKNQGICQATNQAIKMAQGDYIVFLDHDDRLSPDALFHVAYLFMNFPNTDIVYSDRDMLSPEGLRFMHLFKPGWSPETLLSGNYLFHLVAYRRELLQKLGGVRVGLEGSQDYDLILRATDVPTVVRHLPKVLYHWRQHQHSVSLEHNVKEYAYLAGIRALQETLQRRHLDGEVSENKELWRGHYHIRLYPPSPEHYHVIRLTHFEHYAQQVNQACLEYAQVAYLLILGPGLTPMDHQTISELASWFQIAQVGLVTGKILDTYKKLLHTGLIQRPQGIPLALYEGFPETTAGYMASTSIVRNFSTPHPACCFIRRSLWQSLNGLNTDYLGPHAMLDFALRALQHGVRTVYTPFARFIAEDWQKANIWLENDRQRFSNQWKTWLTQGDPYYHPHLTLDLPDMGLKSPVQQL